jgi:4-hydroxy-tetrahydrodipicolinate synthase
MAIEGCGVSACVIWKDEACSIIDEEETRKHFGRLVGEVKGWGYLVAGGVETEVDTTTRAEKKKLVQMAIQEARGEVPVFCGVHSDSLWEQVEMANEAKELGVKGVLLHLPLMHPGFPPPMNSEYIIEHMRRFDEEVNLPIALYANSGGTTVGHNSVSIDTMKKAADLVKNFQAWKIGGGNLNVFYKAHEVLKNTQVNTCPAGSLEPQLFITHAMGWSRGTLSGGANFAAKWDIEVMRKAMTGDLNGAMALANRLKPIFDVVYGALPGMDAAGFVERYKIHGWLAGLIPETNMRYPRLPRPKVEVEALYKAMRQSGLYEETVLRQAEGKVNSYSRERLLKLKQKPPLLR